RLDTRPRVTPVALHALPADPVPYVGRFVETEGTYVATDNERWLVGDTGRAELWTAEAVEEQCRPAVLDEAERAFQAGTPVPRVELPVRVVAYADAYDLEGKRNVSLGATRITYLMSLGCHDTP